MKEESCTIDLSNEEEEWVDYPYIGRGRKPRRKNKPGEERIERIIGG